MNRFHEIAPYSLSKKDKTDILLPYLCDLTASHREKCVPYDQYLQSIGFRPEKVKTLAAIPFLPVRAFKELNFKSIPDEKVFKLMTSSGTTGQRTAKIYLDKENAVLQQKVLLRLLGDFVGTRRKPMLVIDTPKIMTGGRTFGTRSATLIGLRYAASQIAFALCDDFSLDKEEIVRFLEKYGEEEFLVFGFTYMVWQYFFEVLAKERERFDFSKGALLTTGGWKKLQDKAVSHEEFKEKGRQVCQMGKFVDHYGMAEQTGSIYAECEYGHLHASIYSDVIARRPKDFTPCEIGEPGIIQVLSVLPHSYPGHSLLTEDKGIILGEDDCPCGRKGKYIKVLGRMSQAELRGCSDTLENKRR